MKKRFLTLVVLFLYCHLLQAQYYSTGTDRGSIRWRQINTKSYQLVYPEYFEKEAVSLAKILQNVTNSVGYSLGHTAKKIPIILHTEIAKSNGYVAWAPKRSEFYTTTPNEGLVTDWLTHLATHEYRHVVQLDKLNKSTTKVLRILFGEQAIAVVLGLNIPGWFLEGDAVLTETLLTNGGRGRSGEFTQKMKAYLLGNEKWDSYDRVLLGSYKNYIPNKYVVGYHLVVNTRKNYGMKSWEYAIDEVARKPYRIGSFGRNIINTRKRNLVFDRIVKELEQEQKQGNTFNLATFFEQWKENKRHNNAKTLFHDNLNELKVRWQQEKSHIDTTAYKPLSPNTKYYTDYKDPQVMADGSILAVKSGMDDYEQFVVLKNGKERFLYTPGFITGRIHLQGNLLLWTEAVPHVRWEEVSRNRIYCLDIKTMQKKAINLPFNLFMPTLDSRGKRLLTLAKKRDYKKELMVFEFGTDKLLFQHDLGTKNIIDPVFLDESHIAYLFVKDGMGIEVLDMNTHTVKTIAHYPHVVLADFKLEGDEVYFRANFNGKNDFYRLNTKTQKLEKITESLYGIRDVLLKAERLVYANYTPMGYKVAEMPLKYGCWEEVTETAFRDDFLLESMKGQEPLKNIKLPEKAIRPSKPYHKLRHLLNVHSWSPLVIDRDLERVDLGISVQSQNLLGTMLATGGYRLKNRHADRSLYGKISYRGWYPILSSELSYGKKKRIFFGKVETPEKIQTLLLEEDKKVFNWNNTLALPFNLSRGKYSRNLVFSANYELRKDKDIVYRTYYAKNRLKEIASRQHQMFSYSLFYVNKHKMSFRNIGTRWGQVVKAMFCHDPFNHSDFYTYSLQGKLFLPGLMKNHNWSVYAGIQHLKNVHELVDTHIHTPRGTVSMLGTDNYSFSADYTMPIAYPEWNFIGLAYFKRFKSVLFYDTKRVEALSFHKNISSVGVEFLAETHFLRLPLPVDIGFRMGYETQTNKYFSDFLLSFSF